MGTQTSNNTDYDAKILSYVVVSGPDSDVQSYNLREKKLIILIIHIILTCNVIILNVLQLRYLTSVSVKRTCREIVYIM